MSLFPDLSLSVILPAYNEGPRLAPMVRRAAASLQRAVGRFEILLMDDCSSDDSGRIADALAQEIPQVRVIHNRRNLRQGGCLKVAFGLAQYDLVTHNAVDYPFDFDDLPQVLTHFPAADVVVITRRTYPGVTAARRFVSWGNRTLLRLFFGLNISDYNFVQIYKRTVLMQDVCFSQATAFVTVERIVRAHHAGARVVAVEAEYHPRRAGASSSGNWRVVRDSLRDIGRLWFELKRSRSAPAVDRATGGQTR